VKSPGCPATVSATVFALRPLAYLPGRREKPDDREPGNGWIGIIPRGKSKGGFMQVRRFLVLGGILTLLGGGSSAAWADDPNLGDTAAQMDPVVVSASKLPTVLSQTGSSVTLITAKDLEAEKDTTVVEALRNVPGLDVVETGGPGQLAQVYIHGAGSEQTLVMVNGVEINGPISPNRAADLSRLSVDNVAQIEIIRGPQSALFGSGAMGGVINIITKKGTKNWEGAASVYAGKYNTQGTVVSAAGTEGDLDLSLGASWDYSEGFSAAKRTVVYPASVPDLAPNGYRIWTADLGLGYALTPDLSMRLTYRILQGWAQLDNFGTDAGDALNYTENTGDHIAHWEASWKGSEHYRQTLSLGDYFEERTTDNLAGSPLAEVKSDYQGRNLSADWRHELDLPLLWSALAAGLNYKQEQGKFFDETLLPGDPNFTEHSAHTTGVYAEERLAQWGFVLDAGVREDVHDLYGSAFTYRVAPLYTLAATGTTFKGTLATGFNAPTLYQFYSAYGNLNLQPEKSRAGDAGVEQELLGKMLRAGATYFKNDFDNQISFYTDPVTYKSYYINLEKVETQGWEAFVAAEPVTHLNLRLGYTKLTANDMTHADTLGPVPLLRRADYKITLDAGYQWHGAHLQVNGAYVGPRWDDDFDPVTYMPRQVSLAPYLLVNLATAYDITPALSAYVKIYNLLDKDYTEVIGYNTPRFTALAGIQYQWK
jgi:vitamin B12 transporter